MFQFLQKFSLRCYNIVGLAHGMYKDWLQVSLCQGQTRRHCRTEGEL